MVFVNITKTAMARAAARHFLISAPLRFHCRRAGEKAGKDAAPKARSRRGGRQSRHRLALLHFLHQVEVKDIGGHGRTARRFGLGDGTRKVVIALRLLTIVLGSG